MIEDNKIEEVYWGINTSKILAFKEKLEKIKETDELLRYWDEFINFNIPLIRKGLDIVLTTDTGIVIGSGKLLEKLENVTMGQMDYHLHEVDPPAEIQ